MRKSRRTTAKSFSSVFEGPPRGIAGGDRATEAFGWAPWGVMGLLETTPHQCFCFKSRPFGHSTTGKQESLRPTNRHS